MPREVLEVGLAEISLSVDREAGVARCSARLAGIDTSPGDALLYICAFVGHQLQETPTALHDLKRRVGAIGLAMVRAAATAPPEASAPTAEEDELERRRVQARDRQRRLRAKRRAARLEHRSGT